MASTAFVMLQPLSDVNSSRFSFSRAAPVLPTAICTPCFLSLRRNPRIPPFSCRSIIGNQGCGTASKSEAAFGTSAEQRRLFGSKSRSARRVSVESPGVFVEETTSEGNRKQVDYNWELEWYPMYLTDEMPKSAPLGLTVFDRSLVLFYDGNGDLNCFEDRCPHRLARSRTLPLEDTLYFDCIEANSIASAVRYRRIYSQYRRCGNLQYCSVRLCICAIDQLNYQKGRWRMEGWNVSTMAGNLKAVVHALKFHRCHIFQPQCQSQS